MNMLWGQVDKVLVNLTCFSRSQFDFMRQIKAKKSVFADWILTKLTKLAWMSFTPKSF